MEFSSMVSGLVGLFWWCVPLLMLVALLKSPRVKGYRGELRVRLFAHFMLDRAVYRRLHNVTLATPDGSTQIDHVFVSRYGIFVLETKNMRGWICGDEREAQWTQQFHRRSFRFQNPLRQNFRHTRALENALQVPAQHVHSVVAFVGDSRFRTAMPANVTRGMGFVAYIKSFREAVFTAQQVGELLQRLERGRLAPTLATHRAHVRNLQKRANPGAGRSCPQCGLPLVVRTARSGANAGRQFWGCSGFPKCRVVQNIG